MCTYVQYLGKCTLYFPPLMALTLMSAFVLLLMQHLGMYQLYVSTITTKILIKKTKKIEEKIFSINHSYAFLCRHIFKSSTYPNRCFLFWLIGPLVKLKLEGAMLVIVWYHQTLRTRNNDNVAQSVHPHSLEKRSNQAT